MNLNLKLPAYGRGLLSRRAHGWLPWLVVVAEGAVCDWGTLRGDAGVARIGLPARTNVRRSDFRCLLGMDVLVSPFVYAGWTAEAQSEHYELVLAEIWQRGNVATLWELLEGRAWRLQPDPFAGEGEKFALERAARGLELDGLRQAVQVARDSALLRGQGVYARPEFAEARSRRIAELTA